MDKEIHAIAITHKVEGRNRMRSNSRFLVLIPLLPLLWLTAHFSRSFLTKSTPSFENITSHTTYATQSASRLPSTVDYNLTISQAWRNPGNFPTTLLHF